MLPNVRPSAPRAFRVEIQALRALAVGAVVIFHLRPTWLSGGYVGVDVFFVISGFLITLHLVREYSDSGRIHLRRFYARRVRRLLPAALVVLLAALLAYLTLMPDSTHRQGFLEIIASALYGENWMLAFSSIDYLGAAAAPSLVQHYWSLSVEEQFYLLWPLFLIGVGLVVRRMRPGTHCHAWFVALGILFAASLMASLVVTAANPAWAYFVTPVRVWEFASGGLIALSAGKLADLSLRRPVLSTLVSWAGVLSIVASVVFFSDETPFPGSAALLPVVGAALVIAAGNPTSTWSPMILGKLRPVQFIGGISYSVYLWHWPLIVLFPIVLGRAPGALGTLAIIGLTLVLATLSKYLIEDPFLRRRSHAQQHWPSFAAAALVMALIVLVGSVQISSLDRRIEIAAAERSDMAADQCFGAAALDGTDCGDPHEQSADMDTAFAAVDYADTTLGECGEGRPVKPIGDAVECSFGDDDSDKLVVMVGDSHGDQWVPAVQAIGAQRGWHIVTLFRSSCPFTDRAVSQSGVFQSGCERWKDLVAARITQLKPALVVVASMVPHGYEAADFDVGPLDEIRLGYVSTLTSTLAASGSVVVIKDTPFMGENIPNCLGASPDSSECDRSRSMVLDMNSDPLWEAAGQVEGISRIDLTDAFCDTETCFSVTGGIAIYRDHHHMSASYSRSLADWLGREISEAVPQLP